MNISIRNLHRKTFFNVLIIILLITIIGCVYQNCMVHYESKKYKNPGQLIDVYNHKMHIYSEGEGIPTVVFTVGSGTPSAYTDYYFIQKEISKITRTISYDRLGYGWSDKTTKDRKIDRVVDELHTLLEKSGEKPPYVLVGHSLSSFIILTSEKSAKDMIWKRTQMQLKDWSTNSKQEIVKESTHYIHWDKPNVVIERIKELVNSLK